MPRVDCPSCGAVVRLDNVSRTADEFCPTPGCDYPLFWARGMSYWDEEDTPSEAVTRRLPGTGGLQVLASEQCRACGELNPTSATFCQRCGVELHAPPPPPPEPLPEPAAPPPPPPPTPWSPWSDWRVIAVLVALLVAFMLTGAAVLLSRS